MKHIALLFCGILIITMAFAQAPSSVPFVYADVARNNLDMPVAHRNIGVQLSILKGSSTGELIYQESHLTRSGYFGEFEVTIGDGKGQSGLFNQINWSYDNYFLRVGVDTAGGANFETTETRRLYVPYVLYAQSAGIKHSNGGHRKGFKHYIGELYGGGVVFNFWKDSTGTEHGLVVALTDQGDSISWSNMDASIIGPKAQSMINGKSNTIAVLAQPGHANSAALAGSSFTGGGYHDWYLPAAYELDLLYYNRDAVGKVLKAVGNPIGDNIYWSSTEISGSNAWAYALYGGPSNKYAFSKYSNLYVRAVRAF